ncbi:MAG: dTDP-4-dehydrorhamnose reductase [Candidatus Moranbacteria bacterium]|nr:dTDP-4-dehydrorhamnose reductase [Candidatus Moranbacteria bacterium]
MKNNKKVLILGANGMLGEELVKSFQKGGYSVLAWDVEELDITNKEKTGEAIKRENPFLIINAAAYNAVDQAEEKEEFEKAMQINAYAPENLAKIAKETEAIFVHFVSDYIFDGKKGEYVEDDQPCPISNYGISKAEGEKRTQNAGGKYYLIRTSKIFGKSAEQEGAKKSFFEVMLSLAKEKNELKVIDSEKSCFTYAPDLARAVKSLVENKHPFGIYHLVNEGAVTWYEGVLELFKIAGINEVKVRPVKPEEFLRPAKRPASSVLLNTKFPKLRRYEEALKDWLHNNL